MAGGVYEARPQDLARHSPKPRHRTRPGIESAHPVMNFNRRHVPVNEPVFFLENRSKCRLRPILGFWLQCALQHTVYRLDQHVRAQLGKSIVKFSRAFVGSDMRFPAEISGSRIQPLIEKHGTYTGSLLPICNRPVYRCRAAVFWQNRTM